MTTHEPPGTGGWHSDATTASTTIGDCGEHDLLARIVRRLTAAESALVGPGDDCAVLRPLGDTVITSDMMIEGVDFLLEWHDPFRLGWKAAATNLSDVAAMGALPAALTVSLALPPQLSVAFVERFAEGLSAACAQLAPGCGVVGGDLSSSSVFTIAVSAVGNLHGQPPVLRSGAQPGDVLAVAGALGFAGLGLALLRAGAAAHPGAAPARVQQPWVRALLAAQPRALEAHLAPTPPIALGRVAALAGATAMLDVSDGLSLDAARLASASGVGLAFSSELLVAAGSMGVDAVAGTQPTPGTEPERVPDVRMMLVGGEDHALLATFPPGCVPDGFAPIGSVVEPGGALVTLDGVAVAATGWDSVRAV